MALEDWQKRVVAEAGELNSKLLRLYEFLDDRDKLRDLTVGEVALLTAQSYAMKSYLEILERRIRGFAK